MHANNEKFELHVNSKKKIQRIIQALPSLELPMKDATILFIIDFKKLHYSPYVKVFTIFDWQVDWNYYKAHSSPRAGFQCESFVLVLWWRD